MAPAKAEGALRYRSPRPVPIILLRSVCGLLRSTKTAALEADIVFSDTSTRAAIFFNPTMDTAVCMEFLHSCCSLYFRTQTDLCSVGRVKFMASKNVVLVILCLYSSSPLALICFWVFKLLVLNKCSWCGKLLLHTISQIEQILHVHNIFL